MKTWSVVSFLKIGKWSSLFLERQNKFYRVYFVNATLQKLLASNQQIFKNILKNLSNLQEKSLVFCHPQLDIQVCVLKIVKIDV